tara:strand:- start:1464 stop:2222 length:759 start_codon:yes stop_codon:yes gene_type:complete
MENIPNSQPEPTIPYDIIELPSRGIFYKNNKKTVKVSYLTAVDENILTSPGLINSGEVMDTLLRSKILDKDIDPNSLAECDKQAIFIFLRNTAFGSNYEFTLTDPETGKDFKHPVDLSIVKTKEISISPDDRGELALQLFVSKKTVKLRLLTPSDEKILQDMEKSYGDMKIKPTVTKRLEMCIMEIDGDRDKMNIAREIQILPIKDSQVIRAFIKDAEPGLELNRVATAPSGVEVKFTISFGMSFFRPFFGI